MILHLLAIGQILRDTSFLIAVILGCVLVTSFGEHIVTLSCMSKFIAVRYTKGGCSRTFTALHHCFILNEVAVAIEEKIRLYTQVTKKQTNLRVSATDC